MSTLHVVDSVEQKEHLLVFARRVAEWHLGGESGPAPMGSQVEGHCGGAFVTFWKGKNLRGCIGTFEASNRISETIASVTRSALGDPRFVGNPITREELSRLTIEISLLSGATATADPLSLVPGEHGIIIRQGVHCGCFLPKVAVDRRWSAEEFLSACCTMKAGLPAHAWRSPETEVLLFQADVFSDEAPE